MNLTWQIVKKDARAMATPLTVWLILIAADLLLGVWASHGNLGAGAWNDFDQIRIYHNLLQILQLGFTFAFIVELVQGDPPAGPKAFWRTRPISRPRLLGAKLIAVALFFWLPPVLMATPWWLDSGLGAHDMATAAQEILLRQTAITLPAMALASMTSSLAGVIGTAITGLLVLAASPYVSNFAAGLAGAPYRLAMPPSLKLSLAGWAIGGMLLAGLLQFLMGRTRVSWLTLGAIWVWLISSVVSGTVDPRFRPGWPEYYAYEGGSTFAAPATPDETAPARKEPMAGSLPEVTFAIDGARLHREEDLSPATLVRVNGRMQKAPRTTVSTVHLQILPQFARSQTPLVIEPLSFEMTLRWPPIPGGGQLTRGKPYIESKANAKVLLAAQVLFPDGHFALNSSDAATFGDNPLFGSTTPPTLSGVLKIDVSQPVDVTEARLQEGARSAGRWRVEHWGRIPETTTGVVVGLVGHSAQPANDPVDYFLDLSEIEQLQDQYALVNRAAGSFIAMPENTSARHLRISGVAITLRRMVFEAADQRTVAEFQIRSKPTTPTAPLEDGWLAGASVVGYSLKELGTIDCAAPAVQTEWNETAQAPKD
jgi:hypothetical protein